MPEEQPGFKKDSPVNEIPVALQLLMDRAENFGETCKLGFIGFSRAFDKVRSKAIEYAPAVD